MEKPPLGSGERFAKLKGSLMKRGNVQDPAALAAYIGAKRYGNGKMQAMARKGQERAQR